MAVISALTLGAALAASAQGYTPCIERPMFLHPKFDKPELAKPLFDSADQEKAEFVENKETKPEFMPSEFVLPVFERPKFEACKLHTVYQTPSFVMAQRINSSVHAETNGTAKASSKLKQLPDTGPQVAKRLPFKDPFLQPVPTPKTAPNAYSMTPQARPVEDCCGSATATEANGPIMVPAAPTAKLR